MDKKKKYFMDFHLAGRMYTMLMPTRYESVGCDEGRFISPEESYQLNSRWAPSYASYAKPTIGTAPMQWL